MRKSERAYQTNKMAKHSARNYSIIRMKDGTFAVRVTRREGVPPLTVSGFETEGEARAWIEADAGKDSGLDNC